MKGPTITIMAHQGAQAAYLRNLPLWVAAANGARIQVHTPEDSRIADTGSPDIKQISFGAAQHAGPKAGARFAQILEFLVAQGDGSPQILTEYDTAVLGPILWNLLAPLDFKCCLFPDPNAPKSGWLGQSYTHPPLVFGGEALRLIQADFSTRNPRFERGFWDRQMGLVSETLSAAGLILRMPFTFRFAANTIEDCMLPDLARQIEVWRTADFTASNFWIHGLKTEAAFRVVYSEFKKVNRR